MAGLRTGHPPHIVDIVWLSAVFCLLHTSQTHVAALHHGQPRACHTCRESGFAQASDLAPGLSAPKRGTGLNPPQWQAVFLLLPHCRCRQVWQVDGECPASLLPEQSFGLSSAQQRCFGRLWATRFPLSTGLVPRYRAGGCSYRAGRREREARGAWCPWGAN